MARQKIKMRAYSGETTKSLMPDKERRRSIRASKNAAEQTGATSAQAATAGLRYRNTSIIPIIGTRKIARLEDNSANFKIELSDEQFKKSDQVSESEPVFPLDFCEREMIKKFVCAELADRIELK